MSEKREDGGPAFGHGNHEQGGDPGMSLRDYFAAAALTGLLASQEEGGTYHNQNAEMAYALADAMLRSRNE